MKLRQKMNIFTYEDYIKCIHTLRLNSVFQLAEDEAEYNYKQKKKENVYKDIEEWLKSQV